MMLGFWDTKECRFARQSVWLSIRLLSFSGTSTVYVLDRLRVVPADKARADSGHEQCVWGVDDARADVDEVEFDGCVEAVERPDWPSRFAYISGKPLAEDGYSSQIRVSILSPLTDNSGKTTLCKTAVN